MISLFRVDDRLIHGQISVGWVPYLRATGIIVVSDRLAADDRLASIVKAGGPSGLDVNVVGVDDAVPLCRRGEMEEGKVIVLFENLDDVRRALQAGLELTSLNLGGLRGSGEGVRIKDAIFLTVDDMEIIEEIRTRGISVEIRIMPGDRAADLPDTGDV